MPMLFVECRACHADFPSGIAPTAGTPGGVAILNVLEKCPQCHKIDTYNTSDYHFEGPAPATPPPGGVAVPPSASEALDRAQ